MHVLCVSLHLCAFASKWSDFTNRLSVFRHLRPQIHSASNLVGLRTESQIGQRLATWPRKNSNPVRTKSAPSGQTLWNMPRL